LSEEKLWGCEKFLIHEYFGVDENVVWGIITRDLPGLKIQVVQILKALQQSREQNPK